MNGRKLGTLSLCAMLFALFGPAHAQQPGKVFRIGFLDPSTASSMGGLLEVFRQELNKLGWIEGKNITFEYRFAEQKFERLPELATDLVRLKVDLILVSGAQPASAAKSATTTIPIVMANAVDPVGFGFVASLARPGGNVTGLTPAYPGPSGEKARVTQRGRAKLFRVAVLWHSDGRGQKPQMEGMELAANALRLKLQPLDAREPNDFEALFHAATKAHVGAIVLLSSPSFTSHQAIIVGLATKKRLPSVYVSSDWVIANGLMSYGANSADRWRRASYYVDKILKGAKPADLPVEQPMKFELVINLKAAKQIGLTIPPNVLARADKVIR
jgi:putative ABC transport system substrate-binding protein